jgi:GT2 family glycosyltransferase
MRVSLSVVIPTRNTRDVTLAALHSLAIQSAAPDQIVVVDDAREDGTFEAIASRFPEVQQLHTEGGVGFSRAVNAGVARTTGDVIWLLNSDTEAERDAVERLAASFADDERLGIAGAALQYPDGSPQWSGGRFPTLAWVLGEASGLPGFLGRHRLWRAARPVSGSNGGSVDWVTGAAMAVRREVWETCGPLDEGYEFYGQDLDLCWRARRRSWEVRVLGEVRVVHHHGATIGSDPEAADRAHLAMRWRDLVRWMRLHRGPARAVWAVRAVHLGVWMRVVARRVYGLRLPMSERNRWRSETSVIRGAAREVARTTSPPHPPNP